MSPPSSMSRYAAELMQKRRDERESERERWALIDKMLLDAHEVLGYPSPIGRLSGRGDTPSHTIGVFAGMIEKLRAEREAAP